MFKRDRIFYIACCLAAVGLVLALFDLAVAILALVGAYLLRPTLHALGLAKRYADERQIQIFSRSGNVGFLVVMFFAAIMSIIRMANGEPPDEFHMILVLGLATKAIIGLLMVGDLRKAGVIILVSYGVIMGVFAGLQGFDEIRAGETPWETFAGIGLIVAFVVMGYLARRYPRPIAMVLILANVFFVIKLQIWKFTDHNVGELIGIILPLSLIAACLWGKPDTDTFVVPKHS